MRKYILLSLALLAVISLLTLPSPSLADTKKGAGAPGGFVGPGPEAISAEQAGHLRDDSPVRLIGAISRHLGDEKYFFEDSSGKIILDIDGHLWAGQTVSPENTVEIIGEIDKDWNSTEVDVSSITIVE